MVVRVIRTAIFLWFSCEKCAFVLWFLCEKNCFFPCFSQKKVVPLHRIKNNSIMKAEKFEKYKKCVREIFGKKYHIPEQDLPNTVKDKFTVICAEHGPFVTTFDSLLNKKSGCPSCSKRKVPTNEEFVARCEEVHCGKNYDFSETKYSGSGRKLLSYVITRV